MGCASNLCSSNQPEDKETQSTFAPIPKRHANTFPESGFDARYERVIGF